MSVSATGEQTGRRLCTSLYELLVHAQDFTQDDDEAVALVTQIVNSRQARMGRSRLQIEQGQHSSSSVAAGWLEADPASP
jgi:hypothetical protein